MNKFIDTLKNIWKIDELRQRILFTIGVLAVVRIGAHITLPGIDLGLLRASNANAASNTLFGIYDMFVGGAFSNAAVFALGIMPYISASIILQLAATVIPEVQKLQREGEEGRRKINQWTRFGTVVLAAFQAWAIAAKLITPAGGVTPVVADHTLFTISTILILTAGTVFLMWLGEQITERGLGNGISLIIFIGIIARLPSAIMQEFSLIQSGARNFVVDVVLLTFFVFIIAAVILVTQGQRRIPVQYARRVVGKKVTGGTTQYIPLRVNTAGVMPIIFAQSILFIPATLAGFFPRATWLNSMASVFNERSFVYAFLYALVIIFFTYFYTAIAFNPKDVAENMKKQSGYIPGVRPGAPTADYIDNILTRITLPGSIFLAVIAILPVFVTNVLDVPGGFASFFGGTSLLIMVGVALDTLQQIESYLLMRHYDGFMKSGKIRGRAGVPGGL